MVARYRAARCFAWTSRSRTASAWSLGRSSESNSCHMPYRLLTRDEHFTREGPKRILALDGGGLRGVLSLGFLARIESLLRERHGNAAAFRLGHYFDLIAGTSTGAIIAGALAKGMTVDEISKHYMTIGTEVFKKDWFRQ